MYFILNVSVFIKKGSDPSSQKVSVFPEIGVVFSQTSAKRGGGYFCTRRTLMGYLIFERVGGGAGEKGTICVPTSQGLSLS